MKILNLTILLFFSIMAFSQDSRPAIKMPIKKNSNEYFSTFYSQEKTYTCEEWFSTYAQYYQSNYSTDLRLLKPTEKYALIKGNAQKDSIASFIFDLRIVEILSEQTPQNDYEDFISGTKTVDQMSRYFIEEKLLITGLLFPHNFNRNAPIYLTANGRGQGSQASNDIIDFIEGYNTSNQLVFRLDATVTTYQINPLQLQSLNIIVRLKTGFVYRYKYKHELCELDPISYPDPTGPPQGPNPHDPNDPPHDVVVDNDCLIEPSYYNNPVTGIPYKATIPFNDLNPTTYIYHYNLLGSYTVNGVTTEIWGWVPLEIPNPYTSTVNQAVHGTYGEISTSVYLNPNHSTVKKPIIILDGIDFQSNRFLPDITRVFGGNNTISTLWDGGFDVIFVDFAGGADFMQRNSFALVEFIRSLRVDQKVEKIEAIIGPSMGGQILRHCLLYWEANLESSYGAHGVKLMISADSPWTGANASIGVQAMARINKDKGNAVMTLIDASVNSPAACQLLLVHIEDGLNTSNTEYTSGQHAFKTLWDDELTLLGSVPQKTEKNLALADGSGNGTSTNVSPGEMIMTIQLGVSSGLLGNLCGMYSKINAINTGEQIVDRGGAGICGLIASSKLPRVKLVNTTLDFDSAPGSPFRLDTYLKKIKVGEVLPGQGGFTAKIESVTAGEPFCFIPTFSALGLGSQNMTSNIFNMATNQGAAGYTLLNSPFDYVYFDNVDSGHNEFTSGQQPGSLPFVLYHLQYQKVQETKCNIIEGFIPLNHNIEIKYDQFATLCAPISGIYNVQIPGENECQLTVTFENGEFVFSAPSLQEVCESDVDVCFDVKECDQSYCIKVHVVVIPTEDNHRPGTSNQNVTTHTSLNDIHLNSAISIYPNPTTGKVTIKAQNDISEYRLKILDITGRNLYEQNLTSEVVDLQNFAPGIYNLVLTNKKDGSTISKKITRFD